MAVVVDKEHIMALAKSFDLVGPIYPIVVDEKDGREVSGRHRSLTGKPWPKITRKFKNSFERELFILLSNTQRQPSEEEVKFRLNRVAMEYWMLNKCKEDNVCAELTKLLCPEYYVPRRLQQLLEDRWKRPYKSEIVSQSTTELLSRTDEKSAQVTSAIEKLGNSLNIEDKTYGIGGQCQCPTCQKRDECY
jgi:hypothetical protein